MNCEWIRDLMSWEIDGELGPKGRRQLREHLATCADCARAFDELRAVDNEAAIVMSDDRAPQGLERKILAAARDAAEADGRRSSRLRRRIVRALAVSAAVLLIAFGAAAIGIDSMQAHAQEVSVYGNASYEAGSPAAMRVLVRDGAHDLPVTDANVKISVAGHDFGAFRTGPDGEAEVSGCLPDVAEGSHPMEIVVTSKLGTDRIERQVTLKRTHRVLLTSDKPVYQPGQTIHLRALSLGAMTMRPDAGRPALFSVFDPKGNRIFKKEIPTSEFGVASADCPLADEIAPGRYRVECEVAHVKSEKTLEIKRYVLPKFKTSVELERAFYQPKETIKGTVRADYFFGKQAERAKVRVTLSAYHVDDFRSFATLDGETDAEGGYRFESSVPETLFGIDLLRGDAMVRVEAAVTDGSGHVERAERSVTVTRRSLRIDALPADGAFVDGLEAGLLIVTTYPDGSSAKTAVTLTQGDWTRTVETDDAGVAKAALPRIDDVRLEAKDSKGNRAELAFSPRAFIRSKPFILRTDRACYRGGETLKATVLTSREKGAVYLDLVKSGQTVLTRTVEISRGRAETAIDLAADLFGTLQVSAYVVERDGTISRVSRVVQVNLPEQLHVRPRLSKESYRPGEDVTIDFEVVDAQGRPVRSALGVSVVDEALRHLSESRPGLEARYFSIVEELLKPAIEAPPYAAFSRPVNDVVSDEPAMLLRAAAAHETPTDFGRIGYVSFRKKLEETLALKSHYQDLLGTTFKVVLGLAGFVAFLALYGIPIFGQWRDERGILVLSLWLTTILAMGFMLLACFAGAKVSEAWLFFSFSAAAALVLTFLAAVWWYRRGRPGLATVAVMAPLLALGLMASQGLLTRTDTSSDKSPKSCTPARTAKRAEPKPEELPDKVQLFSLGRDGARERFDPAVAMELTKTYMSPPDSFSWVDLIPANGIPPVRVREFFPETLYWNPQLITDEHGHARLTFPGADSITRWRLTAQSVSARGQLGSASRPLVVFQDFFVDIDFPVALTQGDVVSIPIAVHNYLKEPQTVRLHVERGTWFELLEDPEKSLELKADEVREVRFLFQAKRPGAHRLTVKAFGSKGLNDAVCRGVDVRPDGKEIEISAGERLGAESRSTFTIPREAVDGGTVVVVRLTPAGLGEAIKGLESMVRLPHG